MKSLLDLLYFLLYYVELILDGIIYIINLNFEKYFVNIIFMIYEVEYFFIVVIREWD